MALDRPQVLVTGASGFIGGALVRHLAGRGYQVVATGRQPHPPTGLPPEVPYLRADLASLPELALPGGNAPLVIIHAAGLASDRAKEDALHTANVAATERLFAASAHLCRHFIYISSASVYPAGLAGLISEEQAGVGPLSAYGASKLAAEQTLLHIAPTAGIPLTLLRPRAVYGPGDRHLLPRLRRLVRGRRLLLPGGMAFATSLTHIATLCQVAEAALAQPPAPDAPRILNVADPAPHLLAHILRRALEADMGHGLTPLPVPLWPLRLLARLSPGGPVTSQALDYITHPCLLDLTRMQALLKHPDGQSI